MSATLTDMTINPVVDKVAGEPIAPHEAARITGLTPKQLGRMADAGKLTAARPGGFHRRYIRAEVEALARPAQPRGGES